MPTSIDTPDIDPMRPLPWLQPWTPGGPTVHEAVAALTTGQPHPGDVPRKKYQRRTFAQVAADAVAGRQEAS